MKRVALLLPLLALPRPAHAKGCTEVSDVVGEQRCTRYGNGWSRERSFPLVVEMGLLHGSIAPDARRFAATLQKNGPTVYSFDGRSLASSISAWGFDFRIHGFFTPWLYGGIEWAVLFGHASAPPLTSDGWSFDNGSGVNFFEMHPATVLGTRIPLTHATSLRVEGLLGLDAMILTQQARHGTDASVSASAANLGLYLTTRAVLDLWTGPWTTVSLWGGSKPLHPSDWEAGLSVALHVRPFDGSRR